MILVCAFSLMTSAVAQDKEAASSATGEISMEPLSYFVLAIACLFFHRLMLCNELACNRQQFFGDFNLDFIQLGSKSKAGNQMVEYLAWN